MRWCFNGSTQIKSRPIRSSHWVCICVCASGGCWVIGSSKNKKIFYVDHFYLLKETDKILLVWLPPKCSVTYCFSLSFPHTDRHLHLHTHTRTYVHSPVLRSFLFAPLYRICCKFIYVYPGFTPTSCFHSFFYLVHQSFKLCSPGQISGKIWAKVKEVKLIARKTGGRTPRFCSPDPFLSAVQLPCIEVCFVPMLAFIQLCLIRVTYQKGNRYDIIEKIFLQDLDRLLVNLCIWRKSTNVKQLGPGFYLFTKCLAPSKCSHGAN